MPRCANGTSNSTSTISNTDNLSEEFTVDDESCMFVANSSNIFLVVNEPVNQQIFNCSSTDEVRIFPGKTLPQGILISEDGKLVGSTENPMDPAVFKLCWADSTREVCIDSTLQVLSSLRQVEYPRDVLKLDKHVSTRLCPRLHDNMGPLSFKVYPPLPSNLSLNEADGCLTGSPSSRSDMQLYTVTVKNMLGHTKDISLRIQVHHSVRSSLRNTIGGLSSILLMV
ncbi:hypothetical protein GUITHDRAFT_100556 [Guillardia theta CCMP2712]|uniref:Uncharacterized protein n=1 Tax=Guillardia theta (strain CCMP2712) TaxID=905079 RepID=L1JYW6_GUITC|nr:hypothetical protein GUITHDRAFT_100556 [Guillardia theta CCMP2712]EKX53572.1 hypothetical protein GUITHDRAFT_100556 [Guillardia theta CCMP2712]|eukprot:XP_005840552.1 hypothetical protein GUITHDRAFT_100556 [Guillardia theta CCMP2712]